MLKALHLSLKGQVCGYHHLFLNLIGMLVFALLLLLYNVYIVILNTFMLMMYFS